MVYAANTKVDVDKTRYEIERTLRRYGADQFIFGSDDERGMAMIQFRAHQRIVRFILQLPSAKTDRALVKKTYNATQKAVEQAGKSRWRALLLCVKAKLESVESKIETFEEAFLAHVVLPDDTTTAEWLKPQIKLAYETGQMPKSLLALPAPEKGASEK